jgi:hypothetical protein
LHAKKCKKKRLHRSFLMADFHIERRIGPNQCESIASDSAKKAPPEDGAFFNNLASVRRLVPQN